MKQLTAEETKDVYRRLLKGAVYRSSLVSLFFAVSFVAYGLTSLATLQKFEPTISLWDNLWPRILLNGVPFGLFAWLFRSFKTHTTLKIWLWTLGFPVIMFSACMIHVWPAMLKGSVELYVHVHAANALIIVMAMIMVGPPPKFLAISALAILLLFVAPVSAILVSLQQMFYLRFFLTDMSFVFMLGTLGSHMNYTLRRKLASEDVLHQRKVGRFLGNLVSESIFENNDQLVRARKKTAFLISIDVRNFTKFTKSASESDSSQFKERYHMLVSKCVGEIGGFIHKTHGDGHLISVGLMDADPELGDVLGIQKDLQAAQRARQRQQLEHALSFFDKLVPHFEELKREMKIHQNICVCGAIDFGEIGLKMLGDPDVRLEFDIEGLVVIRCARLEAYTKTLRAFLHSEDSFLVVSSAAAQNMISLRKLKRFSTNLNPIVDFQDESFIYYREHKLASAVRKIKAS